MTSRPSMFQAATMYVGRPRHGRLIHWLNLTGDSLRGFSFFAWENGQYYTEILRPRPKRQGALRHRPQEDENEVYYNMDKNDAEGMAEKETMEAAKKRVESLERVKGHCG